MTAALRTEDLPYTLDEKELLLEEARRELREAENETRLAIWGVLSTHTMKERGLALRNVRFCAQYELVRMHAVHKLGGV